MLRSPRENSSQTHRIYIYTDLLVNLLDVHVIAAYDAVALFDLRRLPLDVYRRRVYHRGLHVLRISRYCNARFIDTSVGTSRAPRALALTKPTPTTIPPVPWLSTIRDPSSTKLIHPAQSPALRYISRPLSHTQYVCNTRTGAHSHAQLAYTVQ